MIVRISNYLIITMVIFFSCQNNEPKKEEKNLYMGLWGLTNYFDTIIANKKLAEYRLQQATWFGFLLDIKGDTLSTYGSISKREYMLNPNSDTLTILKAPYSTWLLKKQGKDTLILSQMPDQRKPETTKYIYRRREDLSFLIEGCNKSKNCNQLGARTASYFGGKIFSGYYEVIDTKQKIQFKENGGLDGEFLGCNSYQINNHFGTSHPSGNLDVISFFKKKYLLSEYNWKFKNNVLILTKFEDSLSVRDEMILSEKKIFLKRME